LVTVVEQQAPIPRAGALDLRCEALWLDLVCESPLEHWSVGLEAFGVALDEPADAFRGLRGDRIGVGLDLGWETVGEAAASGGAAARGGGGYELACDVNGEVLLGDEVLTFDGWGSRRHTWGVNDWWAGSVTAGAGRLDDGSRWRAALPAAGGAVDPSGSWVHDDGAGRPDGLPSVVSIGVGGREVVNEVRHISPIPLDDDAGRSARALHALCRSTTGGGPGGASWLTLTRPAG